MMHNAQKVCCLRRGGRGGGCPLVVTDSTMQRMVHTTELVALITSIVVEGFFPSNISHCFPFSLTAEPSAVAKSCLRSQRGTFLLLIAAFFPQYIWDISHSPRNLCLCADQNKRARLCLSDITAQVKSAEVFSN